MLHFCSPEIRELESKLRAGYTNKERAVQLLEKEAIREQEKVRSVFSIERQYLEKFCLLFSPYCVLTYRGVIPKHLASCSIMSHQLNHILLMLVTLCSLKYTNCVQYSNVCHNFKFFLPSFFFSPIID